MSTDQLTSIRQYSWAAGPNYTDSPLTLAETECAESDNLFFDGVLKTVPGASRLVPTAMANTLVGLYQYAKSDGTLQFMAVNSGGRLAYQNDTTWVNVSLGTLTLTAAGYSPYNWITFNDTLVVLNKHVTPYQWDGSTWARVSGTPPHASYGVVHTDYILLAGQTSAPSQVQYSDATLLSSWPVGNVLNVGLDDGQIITGLIRLGDTTTIFKDSSIYLLTGATASDFTLQPTLSDVGCVAPNSIVLTDLGIIFWSEAGPAIFNGYKTILLGRRMRRLLDDVNWDAVQTINASYYPYRKQVLIAYPTGSSPVPDRAFILDLYHLGDSNTPTVFWPLTHGFTASTKAVDSVGRKRVYFGHSDGYVTTYDDGVTWNGASIAPRLRTRAYYGKQLDLVTGVRTTDFWFGGTMGRVAIKQSVDGSTFVAHGWSPLTLVGTSLASATKPALLHKRIPGDGSGELKVGQAHQIEVTIPGTTPISVHGIEVGLEPLGRRDSRGP